MKIILAYFATALAAIASAQSSVPVYLAPSADSPQIGMLESAGEIIPADWPTGTDAQSGWQPVYYRGAFEVYVDNNDIGKDVSPKPGSLYYLAPNTNAPKLAVATKKDNIDILSVDTYFCKLRLETIVVGYAPTASIQAGISAQAPAAPAASTEEAAAIKVLQGVLEKSGMIARNRTGQDYKLSNPQGKALALVDVSQLPERVQIEDFIGQAVTVAGALEQSEAGGALILVAQSLKKTK